MIEILLNKFRSIVEEPSAQVPNELQDLNRNFSFYNPVVLEKDQITTFKNNLIEIDLIAAFPKLCNMIFPKGCNFNLTLNNIYHDKLIRNIHIAKHCKEFSILLENKNFEVNSLNSLTKLILLITVYDYVNVEKILTYKKDGILIQGSHKTAPAETNRTLMNFKNISQLITIDYHDIYIYMETYKTEIFVNNTSIKTKGMLKHIPPKLLEVVESFLITRKFNTEQIHDILEKYNAKYIKTLSGNEEFEQYLNDYIIFGNFYYGQLGQLTKLNKKLTIENTVPELVLVNFLYPLLNCII